LKNKRKKKGFQKLLQAVLPPFYITYKSVNDLHTAQAVISKDDEAGKVISLSAFLEPYIDDDDGRTYELGYGVAVASLTERPSLHFDRWTCKQLYHPDVKPHLLDLAKMLAGELLLGQLPPTVMRQMYEAVNANDPPPRRFVAMAEHLESIGYPCVECGPVRCSDGDRWNWKHVLDPALRWR
jgi:hypothetical protein